MRIRHIRNLDDVTSAHISVGDFARFLHVPYREVWEWVEAGLLTVFEKPNTRRGARIATEEARRFYRQQCRRAS